MPRTYTVQPGDTLSGIAQHQLGDASRWPEIFLLNRSTVRHPDRISPGQVLTLPGDTPMQPPPRIYVVRRGDTLSAIAQRELGAAGRWPEIFERNRDVVSDPQPDLPRPGPHPADLTVKPWGVSAGCGPAAGPLLVEPAALSAGCQQRSHTQPHVAPRRRVPQPR